MGIKRKFEVDVESAVHSYRPMKQIRVTPAQRTLLQPEDIAMEDVSVDSFEVSSHSFDSGSPSYPSFDLYPFPSYGSNDVDMNGVNQTYNNSTSESRTSSNASEENKARVGLMQPKASFVHNVSNCFQIPRLRVACESGINGHRTLWSQCDNCGAIDMIDCA
ncbi:hypothetical protein K439DRAFT_585252 [Ramaria rubella]|nr:hypothetical protein K439DRAFT_585252 [Ramaria rubella]